MPRLNAFTIKIATGERGLADAPKFKINGHSMPLEKTGNRELRTANNCYRRRLVIW